jgi:hypothetical protein
MSEQKENNIMASSNENYQNTEGNVEIIENEQKYTKTMILILKLKKKEQAQIQQFYMVP